MMINWGEELQSKKTDNSHSIAQGKKKKTRNERKTEKKPAPKASRHTHCVVPLHELCPLKSLAVLVNLLPFKH